VYDISWRYVSTVRGATPKRSAETFQSGNGCGTVAAYNPNVINRAATSLKGRISGGSSRIAITGTWRRFAGRLKRRSMSVATSFCDRFDGPPISTTSFTTSGRDRIFSPNSATSSIAMWLLIVLPSPKIVATPFSRIPLARISLIQISMKALGLSMTNGTPLRRIASSMYHLTRKTSTGESCVSPLDER